MRRPFPILVVWLCVVGPAPMEAWAIPEPEDGAARGVPGAESGREKVARLEAAIVEADQATRPLLLNELRQAYPLAIHEAESAGLAEVVASLRGNALILGAPTALDAPSESNDPPRPPSETAETASTSGTDTAQTEQAPGAETRTAQPTNPPGPTALALADEAFDRKHYEDAGKRYAALARTRELPTSRHDRWAYCRLHDVVRRINASPSTEAEWDAIHEEIERVKALSPNNWFSEYLRNLAAERTGRKGSNASRGVVVRGASPDEARVGSQATPSPRPRAPSAPGPKTVIPRTAQPPTAPGPILNTREAVPAPVTAASTIGRPGASWGNWKVWDTPSFRILHDNESLAIRVAERAERARMEQAERWAGSKPGSAWSPRCDIYLYPNGQVFAQQTGQPEDAPGFSTSGLQAGQVTARRINLRADHPKLLDAILPHEVTHIVLADLFPHQQVPRWADEGMAVLSEPLSEQELRAADLASCLAKGELFRLDDLLVMDYPDGRYWGMYYAQSISVARFLIEQGSPRQFIEFLQSTQRNGADAELRRVYGIESVAELQQRWMAHIRSRTGPGANALADRSDESAHEARR